MVLTDNHLTGDNISLGYGSATFADKDVGTDKSITITDVSIGGTDAGNYVLDSTEGSTTADITAKALSITANSTSKTYGQTVTFDGTEFSTLGLVNGDSVTTVLLQSDGTSASASVAGSPYAILASDAVGSGLGNYSIEYLSGTLSVDAKALSITANSTSKTYGQTVSFDGTEFSTLGLVNGDSVTTVLLQSDGASATASVAGSPYAILVSDAVGTGLGNYSIEYLSGMLSVDAKALTITANSTSKTYGQTVSFDGTEFTTLGLVNGDSVTTVLLQSDGASVLGPGRRLTVRDPRQRRGGQRSGQLLHRIPQRSALGLAPSARGLSHRREQDL